MSTELISGSINRGENPMQDAQRFFEFAFRQGDLLSLRGKTPEGSDSGMIGGLFTDHKKAAKIAHQMSERFEATACWFGLNPVDPESKFAARSVINKPETEMRFQARGSDITRRGLYLIDIDPERPSGLCSTDAEKAEAFQVANKVREFLASKGWPDSILLDSGNGYHILFRGDGCGPDSEQWHFCLKHLSELFGITTVTIDKNVGTPAHGSRIPGTWNRKGPNTPERPHRMVTVLHYPAAFEPLPHGLIYRLAGEGGHVSKYGYAGNAGNAGNTETTGQSTERKLLITAEGVEKLIAEFPDQLQLDRNARNYGSDMYFPLASCPIVGHAHHDQRSGRGHSAIILSPTGIGFKCFCDRSFTFGDLLKKLQHETGRWPSMPIWEPKPQEPIDIDALAGSWGGVEDLAVTDEIPGVVTRVRGCYPGREWEATAPDTKWLTFEHLATPFKEVARHEYRLLDPADRAKFQEQMLGIYRERNLAEMARYLGAEMIASLLDWHQDERRIVSADEFERLAAAETPEELEVLMEDLCLA